MTWWGKVHFSTMDEGAGKVDWACRGSTLAPEALHCSNDRWLESAGVAARIRWGGGRGLTGGPISWWASDGQL